MNICLLLVFITQNTSNQANEHHAQFSFSVIHNYNPIRYTVLNKFIRPPLRVDIWQTNNMSDYQNHLYVSVMVNPQIRGELLKLKYHYCCYPFSNLQAKNSKALYNCLQLITRGPCKKKFI